MSDGLKEKMLSALTWRTLDRFGQQAVQLVITLILARLLTPDDYGIIGILSIFVGLSNVLVDGGFGQALIREKNAKEIDYSTIFYFNIFISFCLYCILFFSLPFISTFFNAPQLTPIGRVLFISILFSAVYVVAYSRLVKALDYKKIAIINTFSILVSGTIGVMMAFYGFGVWSLVFQQLFFQLIWALSSFLFIKWKPKFLFSFAVIRKFWHFSIHLLGTTSLNVIFNHLYIIIIGRFYSKSEVGLYNRASKLSDIYSYTFQSILQSSTYSLFSQIHDDPGRLTRIFRNVSQKISLVSFPIIFFLIVAAKPIVYVLLSDKWMEAVPYFQLLCLAALFLPFYNLNIVALNAKGLSKITFKIEIIKKVLILSSVLLCFNYGIIAMLWGYVVSCTISYFISVFYLKKGLNHFIISQFKDICPGIPVGITIAIAIGALALFIGNPYTLFAVQLSAGVIIYIVILYLFFRDSFMQIFSLIKSRLKK